MKSFRWSTFAGASLGALVFTFAGPGSAFAGSFGSSGGGSHGSSGGSSGGGHVLFSFYSHGSSGGSSHGSSGGSSHGSLFKGHGSSGGSSHGSLFSHGSSGGSSHGSLFSHGSSGGSSHGSLFSHGSSGGSSHGSLFKGHGSSGGSSHGSLFKGHGSSGGGSSGGSSGRSSGGSYVLGYNGISAVPTTLTVQNTAVATDSNVVAPTAAVAYLNISVPADAKVYLQDQLMTVEGTQRRFVSPELPVGSQHVYNVRVDVVRNGQTVSKSTQALVMAGQEIAVSVQPDGQNPKELVATVATVASR